MNSSNSRYWNASSSSSSSSDEEEFEQEYTDDMPEPPQALTTAANQFDVGANLMNQLILNIGMAFEPTVRSQLGVEDARTSFEENYEEGNGLPSNATVAGQMNTLWDLRETFVAFYWECVGGGDSDSSDDSDDDMDTR